MGKNEHLNVAVQFRGVSLGMEKARLGLRFQRAHLTIAQAEKFLCGARLRLTAILESDGQGELLPNARLKIESVADSQRYSAGPNDLSAGLTFNRKDVDLTALCAFMGKSGTLAAERIGDAGEGETTEIDGENAE